MALFLEEGVRLKYALAHLDAAAEVDLPYCGVMKGSEEEEVGDTVGLYVFRRVAWLVSPIYRRRLRPEHKVAVHLVGVFERAQKGGLIEICLVACLGHGDAKVVAGC